MDGSTGIGLRRILVPAMSTFSVLICTTWLSDWYINVVKTYILLLIGFSIILGFSHHLLLLRIINYGELIRCWFRFQFFAEYNSKLLESSNYITRRQAIKVREAFLLLMDNFCWIIYFRKKFCSLGKFLTSFAKYLSGIEYMVGHKCLMYILYLKPSSYYIDTRSLICWSSFC